MKTPNQKSPRALHVPATWRRWPLTAPGPRIWVLFSVFQLTSLGCPAPTTEAPKISRPSAPIFHAPKNALRWISAPQVSAERRQAAAIACEEIFSRLGGNFGNAKAHLRQAQSAADFQRRTGRPVFEAAAVLHDTIWLQPEEILRRQPDVRVIFRHECVHLWFRLSGFGALPPLLEEVFALGFSGQAATLAPARPLVGTECRQAEAARAQPKNRTDYETWMRRAVSTFWGAVAKQSPAETRRWLDLRRHDRDRQAAGHHAVSTTGSLHSCAELSRHLPRRSAEKVPD